MGSAALAAAVPYPVKATRISQKELSQKAQHGSAADLNQSKKAQHSNTADSISQPSMTALLTSVSQRKPNMARSIHCDTARENVVNLLSRPCDANDWGNTIHNSARMESVETFCHTHIN